MLMPRKRYTKELKAQAVDLVRHGKPGQEWLCDDARRTVGVW